MLGTLGIDYEKPAGFTYSNSQVGTVEYSHGEGNTLGSISVNIRQIPVLQEIRLVKDLGEVRAIDRLKFSREFGRLSQERLLPQNTQLIVVVLTLHDTF